MPQYFFTVAHEKINVSFSVINVTAMVALYLHSTAIVPIKLEKIKKKKNGMLKSHTGSR